VRDGRHDFDFIFGRWHVRNRKLRDVTNPACDEWVEFDASSEAYPILDGYGHIDRIYVSHSSDGSAFEGFTLRLFDPASGLWRIWWSSTRVPGVLDPPVEGGFDNGHGIFECEDEIGDRSVVVRFEWLVAEPAEPWWQQSFSYDGGDSWKPNWEMRFTRAH
jgi:hypothetical protein